MKRIIALLPLCWLILNPAHAETIEYDFEIIIFEDKSGRYANSEQWQQEFHEETSSPVEAQRNPGTSSKEGTEIKITPIKGIGLKKYANKLKANKRYNVLVHKSWRQTGFADDAAIDIPIGSKPTASVTGKAVTSTTTQAAPYGNKNDIYGSIKIELGRYLHIYTDLIYQQPNKAYTPGVVGEDSQPYKQYPINFHRRMRSKELHYLDHPMVGILVMAMPVKKPKENT